ncbi:MAG: mannose-1-phosphate guanylyltransferase [Candidatus Hodarchaeales archaeon]
MPYVVILAGGGGERLWPKSRKNYPKQCISLNEGATLIQQTYARALRIVDKSKILLSTRKDLLPIIKKQIPEVEILAEPVARDSAAGMGYVCVNLIHKGVDEPTVFMGADYHIGDVERFIEVIRTATKLAEKGKIVTIGIKPRRVETRFGYINLGEMIPDTDVPAFEVQSFTEKPNAILAKEYIAHGYLWNSGMFVVKPSVLYENFKKFMPRLYEALEKIRESDFDPKKAYDLFLPLEKISIDYGVMEQTTNLVVVKGDFDWDDIGTWDSLERILEPDEDGNIVKGTFLGIESGNCVVFSKKPVITLGVEDLVIIESTDCIFVCPKEKARNIKKVTSTLASHPELKRLLKF